MTVPSAAADAAPAGALDRGAGHGPRMCRAPGVEASAFLAHALREPHSVRNQFLGYLGDT
jgi:hypothetical protein